MKGAVISMTLEKITPSASANKRAWNTSSLARSRLPAPRARAIADVTPAPIPLLVVCRTSITNGKASEAPARALVPMRPWKKPSKTMTPTNASRFRTFGAASRSSVGRIGASSSSFVRAAAAGLGALVGADSGAGLMVWALMGAPMRVEAALENGDPRASGGCIRNPMARQCAAGSEIVLRDACQQTIITWGDPRFSHECGSMVLLLDSPTRQYPRPSQSQGPVHAAPPTAAECTP